MSLSSVQELNEELFAQLNPPVINQCAIDAVNAYTRAKVREFSRRPLQKSELQTDKRDVS